jgi:hypothetical protein
MRNRVLMMALATVGMTAGFATPASAQATRTWVSGVGDDVNPCSRTAPCKTFAGAISKTAVGGEINCLDPGGFGAVTITKSLTISCPYTEGGALAGGNGITVNDALSAAGPNTADVFLRGLDIFGVNPPTHGVRFISGRSLHIEDSTIRRFNAANSLGVSFAPAGNARLYIARTTIADNGNANTGGGIEIKPSAGGSAFALLTNVRADNNANAGLRGDSTNGAVTIVADDSSFSGNATGMAMVGGASNLRMMLTDSNIVNNTGTAIVATGANATMRVGNTSITGNAQGVLVVGAFVLSYGDNRLDGNPTTGPANDLAFSLAPIPKK